MNTKNTASQPKVASIGDDAGFVGRMIALDAAPADKAEEQYDNLIAYIDQFRATEGQAQTSAAGCLHSNWNLRAYKACPDCAAQLADSTEPGAPFRSLPVIERTNAQQQGYQDGIEMGKALSQDEKPVTASNQVTALLDAAFGLLQHDTGEQNEEYVFMRNVLKEKFTRILRAAPTEAKRETAQQSLTAGGAVPDLSGLPVHYVEGLENGGYYLCTDVIRKFAAAPLPQVQSEALDAKRYRFLRDQNIFAYIGSFSPYAVRGQTMEMLDGEELDKAIDAAADQQPVTPSGALK